MTFIILERLERLRDDTIRYFFLLPLPPLNIKFAMKHKPKRGKKGHETQMKLFNFHKMNSLVLIQSE